LRLNGETGVFKYTHLLEPKTEKGKHKTTEYDESLELVFLIVRRRLIQPSKDGMVRSTSEHSRPDDVVMMFGEDSQKGVAKALRQRFENLRTEQIVYARFRGEIVRLHVKGASLGSENKDKLTTDFYSYLNSFSGDEHWYNYLTRLVPVQEEGAKTYYAIDFQRGEKLNEEQQKLVVENIETVYENVKQVDDYYGNVSEEDIKKEESKEKTEDVVDLDYPEEEINPDDIPF
jgi:flagella basal body P-ring formation protein FlgA